MWSPTQFGQGQSCISGLVIDSCRAVRHDSDTLYGNQTQVARDQIQQHWIRTSLLLVKLRAHTRQMVAGRFQMSSLAAEVREGCMVLASTHENCEMATNYLGLLGLVLEPNGNCFWRRFHRDCRINLFTRALRRPGRDPTLRLREDLVFQSAKDGKPTRTNKC